MGFNYYSHGNIQPCGVENGYVYHVLPSGKKVTYKTQLDINIPEQTNLFVSDKVAFLLYHESKMYIGRFDKSISVYRMSDDLLVGLNNWEAPMYTETVCCGHYADNSGIYEIHLDLRDNQTVYIRGLSLQGVLSKPIVPNFDVSASSFSATVWGDRTNYHIYTTGGEPVEVDVWTIQDDVRRRNCRIFL